MHINLFADMIIGSLLPRGSISYLYYADRLNQLPLGVVGIAVGTALLPMLSRAMSGGRQEEARNLFNRALEISLFLALPAAVGLFAIAPPIILTLFRHGAFDFKAAEATSLVLTAYSLGLPAYIMSKVYSTVYWAKHDTTTPVKASVVSALLNVAGSLILIYYFRIGVVGIALSTSIAGWVQIALLQRGLCRMPEISIDRRLREAASRIVISCLCMGLLLFIFRTHTSEYFLRTDNHIEQILLLALMVFAGGSCYGMAAVATGAVKLQELKRYIKKG
jgi:putative peptidoglycan lipid II flippase